METKKVMETNGRLTDRGAEIVAGLAPIGPEGLIFWYRNYKGEGGYRRVRPLRIRFGMSEWHPEAQWLMLAYDLENNKEREFAMRDMSGFVGNRDIELGFVVPPKS